jgi:phospholipase C
MASSWWRPASITGSPSRFRFRTVLHVEQLEDRTVPAPLSTLPVPMPSLAYNNVNATAATSLYFAIDMYKDALQRDPDLPGLTNITNLLNSGKLDGGGAFAGFVTSPEYLTKISPVVGLYEVYLGRAPDVNGLRSTVSAVQSAGLAQATLAFMQTPEFLSRNGSVLSFSTASFLSFAYQAAYNRAPTAAETAAFQDSPINRALLLDVLVTAPEILTKQPKLVVQTYVDAAYVALWDINPDGNFNSYVTNFTTAANLGNTFINHSNYIGIGMTRNWVVASYEGLVGRNPSIAEYRVNRNLLLTSPSSSADQAFENALVATPEFQATANGASASATATALFQTLLGRKPTSSSSDQSIVTLLTTQGKKAGDVAAAITNGTEFSGNSYNQNIQHTIIIYQENQSFDGLYGLFPGATGLSSASKTIPQVDPFGNPYTSLPGPFNPNASGPFGNGKLGTPDPNFPASIPVGPYNLNQFIAPSQKTGDISHIFYTEQLQIDNGYIDTSNGSMDKYAAYSTNPGLVQSYFDATNLPEGLLAQQFTLDDDFFHSAFGGSYLNHQFLIASQAPQWNQPIPSGFTSSFNPTTKALTDTHLTFDGKFVVNTTFSNNLVPSFFSPNDPQLELSINDSNPNDATRPFEQNIGDRLSGAGISWKWYSGGWNAAISLQKAYVSGDPAAIAAARAPFNDPNNPLNLFQWHHQPFAYFDNTSPLTPNGQAHLQDEQNLLSDLQSGNLPTVAFDKALGPDNEHPGYANVLQGQQHVASLVQSIQNSAYWGNTAIIITYDEHGGRWDQVTPFLEDKWGPGTRVPAIEISPFARRGFVDHTQYETNSILRTVEQQYGLKPVGLHDGSDSPLYGSFSFAVSILVKNNGKSQYQ